MAEMTQETIDKLAYLYHNLKSAKHPGELPEQTSIPDKMYVPAWNAKGECSRVDLRDVFRGVAGRYWDETGSSPTAAGYYGDLQALRDLPRNLGLGRYLVTDDRVRRKLDPSDSTKFEDGTTAALDGSMGQCMWCWNAHYYTTWEEDNKTIETISFSPIRGRDSIYVSAGGISWFNAGVMDRDQQMLCSVISADERYRGGGGSLVATSLAGEGDPQKTMLGMAATSISTRDFGLYARKRGKGWEANWFVARAVVEYLIRIILGTRNSQAIFKPEPDVNGLMQGGLGIGVTTMGSTQWIGYNNYFPLVQTAVGLEVGDGVGIVGHVVPYSDGTSAHTFQVPVFFGLVNPFGNLWTGVRGLIIEAGEDKTLVWVAPSMYEPFDDTTTAGLLPAAELPRENGYIRRLSMNRLCCLPTEVGASGSTYHADFFFTDADISHGLRVRFAGGTAHNDTQAGTSVTNAHNGAWYALSSRTAPLCYFEEDPSPLPVTEKNI